MNVITQSKIYLIAVRSPIMTPMTCKRLVLALRTSPISIITEGEQG